MSKPIDTTWVRTRVTAQTKALSHETALLLGWTVPGVECACIELMFTIFTPQELADHVQNALRMQEPDVGEE